MTIPCQLSRLHLFSVEEHDVDFGEGQVMEFPGRLLRKWWDFPCGFGLIFEPDQTNGKKRWENIKCHIFYRVMHWLCSFYVQVSYGALRPGFKHFLVSFSTHNLLVGLCYWKRKKDAWCSILDDDDDSMKKKKERDSFIRTRSFKPYHTTDYLRTEATETTESETEDSSRTT